MNEYDIVKSILKSSTREEINNILNSIDLETSKEVIKLLVSRINNLHILSMIYERY